MYTRCLFCNSDLGRNDALERFPVGARLAFDAANGRLWVVCRRCERWNLTPLEERWEAIEDAERLFSETRLRVSTDNIGLARLPGGLELVRVGRALRPELAAWRYGDQFGRRRRRHLLYTGAAVAVGAGVVVLGPIAGVVSLSVVSPVLNTFNLAHSVYRHRRVIRVPLVDGTVASIRHTQLKNLRLVADDDLWALRVPAVDANARAPRWRPHESDRQVEFRGPDALRAAAAILPLYNDRGAGARQVQEAVSVVEQATTPDALFRAAAAAAAKAARDRRRSGFHLSTSGSDSSFRMVPGSMRLALEMAVHEESERRALEGELGLLEAAWREAEEIAGIADDLLTPAADRAFIARHRGARDDE